MTSFTVIPKPEVPPLIASGRQMLTECIGTLFQIVSCRLLVTNIGNMFYKRVILWNQGLRQRTENCRVYKFAGPGYLVSPNYASSVTI